VTNNKFKSCMIDYSFPMLNGELTKFDFFNIKKP